MRSLVLCLLVACAAPAWPVMLSHHAPAPPVVRMAPPDVGYWTLGEPIPANQRGPILREPALELATLPPVRSSPRAPRGALRSARGAVGLACVAELATTAKITSWRSSADEDQLLAALARLVEVGRSSNDACATAVDSLVGLQAEIRTQHVPTMRSHEFWMLAGRAASTTERQVAAFHNAALFAWHEARLFVRSAMRDGGEFPLDPWIDAGDAAFHAGEHELALDAFENALRASRARELSRTKAAHIARTIERLPGERAAMLRARIQF